MPTPNDSPLVPRLKDQGYTRDQVDQRRRWVEEITGAELTHVGSHSIPTEEFRGNIENPIGAVQMPLGVAGPLLVHGERAQGTFYVPFATTEGALVRSYERGMVTLTRAGGAQARLFDDHNRIAPVFYFDDVAAAHWFAQSLPGHFPALAAAANATTRHGRLLAAEPHAVGRKVLLNLRFHTGDAHGMNMISRAADAVCKWIMANTQARRYLIFSGLESEKHASGFLLPGGKGKNVVAGARIPAEVCRTYLRATPQQYVELWQQTVTGHLRAGALGYNGHLANGLTAMFIALGQDVANVVNSAIGITVFETTEDGDLYASVTLPSLTIASVGGGTGLGSSRECLRMVGCAGLGGAAKLAEIIAASALAGEISMGAAIVSGEFVAAHESYGRNRPKEEAGPEITT